MHTFKSTIYKHIIPKKSMMLIILVVIKPTTIENKTRYALKPTYAT